MSQVLCADECREDYGFLEAQQKCVKKIEATEEPGDHCQFGGSYVKYVADANGDGEIQESEVILAEYNCEPGDCQDATKVYSDVAGRCVLFDNQWISIPAGTGDYASLQPYSMMKTEVTVAAFEECVTAGACSSESYGVSDASTIVDGFYFSYGRSEEFKTHPMNGVNYYGAAEYCAFIGGRLPTLYEWQYAGLLENTDGTIRSGNYVYPWGAYAASSDAVVDWHCKKANYRDERDKDEEGQMFYYCVGTAHSSYAEDALGTAPVGSYEEGASPLGLMDMIGNVGEWAAGFDNTDESQAFLLGGSFRGILQTLLFSQVVNKTSRLPPIGFRCVKDAE